MMWSTGKCQDLRIGRDSCCRAEGGRMSFYLFLGFVLALIAMVFSAIELAAIVLGFTTYRTAAQVHHAIAILGGGMVFGAIILGAIAVTAIWSWGRGAIRRVRKRSVSGAYITGEGTSRERFRNERDHNT